MPSKSQALYDLTNCLQPARRVWKQAATEALADEDISITLAAMVVAVYRNSQGITQKALAEEIGINPGALVRLLDQATQAKLLERRELPGDRRARTLFILPEGERLAKKVEDAADQLRHELMQGVSQEEIEQAVRTVRLFEERAVAFLQRKKEKV
ncbi:MarR family winged helix-turn-helix transcriptional regulator [Marinobacterium lutimaris]|uniref:Transcriptional regulator, MarR family n=1 Tax=Marinobacterium lutimaris TaxID=568106 RepID=A0A1H5VNU4_9GAMM|nr:MarR family transcriptional regulator [Marinobacterium lutimaris]SEF89005.1 transcriptional regulator, MarR family [Marinobacterium lutimaris]